MNRIIRVLSLFSVLGLVGCVVGAGEGEGDPSQQGSGMTSSSGPGASSASRTEQDYARAPVVLKLKPADDRQGPSPDPWKRSEGPSPDPWTGRSSDSANPH